MPRPKLKDLIDGGLLSAGEESMCEPRKGEIYTSRLQSDGVIAYNSQAFSSPSDWASHVARNPRNGWRDVSARGRPLDAYRGDLYGQHETRHTEPAVIPASTGTPQSQPQPPMAQQEEEREIEERLLTRLQSLSGAQFERLIGEFLKAKGFSDVRVTGRVGDGGIDGECSIPFLRLKVAFQAKCYKDNSVGAPPIRNFKGGIVGRYDRGVFITTSSFTPGAQEEAEQPGVTLVLLDGKELVSQMLERGLGVKEVVVAGTVDEDFFESLGG